MSVVIIGGNDKMACQYKELCKQFRCKAKVFTKKQGAFRKQLGSPDLVILFTGTVSHKMVEGAQNMLKGKSVRWIWVHSSSLSALKGVLRNECCGCEIC